ncbi:cytochrome oxidase c subunit VIb-domain-containing protein [Syncephalis plumigaleata]|nr:cytochrome oxidase c subunit VIb-domain-containing protein [Syncephalis plumigaleata]
MTDRMSDNSKVATASEDWRPLTKEQRKTCWKARDAFTTCLDQSNILDGDSVDAKQKCDKVLREFEAACPPVWVEYFKTRRLLEARQKLLMNNSQQ